MGSKTQEEKDVTMIIYLAGNIRRKKSVVFICEPRLKHVLFSFEYLEMRKGFSETKERFEAMVEKKKQKTERRQDDHLSGWSH